MPAVVSAIANRDGVPRRPGSAMTTPRTVTVVPTGSARAAGDGLTEVLDECVEAVGTERLQCLHVNDSKTPLGSNRDRHELVGQGLIGDGLGTFLAHPAFKSLPAITETWENKGEATEDLDRMRDLRRRGVRRWAAWRKRAGPKTTRPRSGRSRVVARPDVSR